MHWNGLEYEEIPEENNIINFGEEQEEDEEDEEEEDLEL